MSKWTEPSKKKVIVPEKIPAKIQELREQHKSIVTLNGSFDLLHAGHLHIMYDAARQGDCLIIALNSDSSVKLYKTLDRPIIPLKFRMEMMAAISFVDYVTWFHEATPLKILEIIQPDVHVNGTEYGEKCIEAEIVKKYGGRIHVVDLVPGLSTSNIIKKIKSCV
jgi:rfaE bifunctional protein nucleotidyltransferase chain/domain